MRSKKTAWLICWSAILVLLVIIGSSIDPGRYLLTDSDTNLINNGIRAQPDGWAFWHSDWPLANHFYRPLSTALFQFDLKFHPFNGWGWSVTDMALILLGFLALAWMVREISDDPWFTLGSCFVFFMWLMRGGAFMQNILFSIALAVFAGGAIRHGRAISKYIPATALWVWLGATSEGVSDIHWRAINWIPGRTATSMAIPALAAIAAFARYSRLSRQSHPFKTKEPSPLDPPATKSTLISKNRPELSRTGAVAWPLLSCLFTAMALACYEQAVVVPLICFLAGLTWSFRGRKVNYWWGLAFGAVLIAYIGVHLTYVPTWHSRYYNWQKRTTATALTELQLYWFFPYLELRQLYFSTLIGPLAALTIQPYIWVGRFIAGCIAIYESKRRWILCGFGWLASGFAYLPMAYFKTFSHYHYWPMMIQSMWYAGLAWIAIELSIIAVAPQAIQAPSRRRLEFGLPVHP